MSLKYDLYQSANTQGTKFPHYHARPVQNQVCSEETLCRHISQRIKFKPEEVSAILSALKEELIEHLSEGRTVQLDEIGNFQVTLKCPSARSTSEIRASSISIGGVSFRPKKRFMQRLRGETEFERVQYKNHSVHASADDVVAILDEFFASHDFITRRDLERIAGLTRSTAVNRIKALIREGYLKNVSHDMRHPVYVKVTDGI